MMTRHFVVAALALALCWHASLAAAEQRGGRSGGKGQAERRPEGREGNERSGQKPGGEHQGSSAGGKKSPGGEWSERSHGGKPSQNQPGQPRPNNRSAGNAAGKNKPAQANGASDAAAGAAAANRRNPAANGAEGAAAGAAAANRNNPQVSGAAGAAAGAAAANRNKPQISGAQGAALGAAAADRNAPAVGGAAGAAAGYAAVRNSFNHPNMYGQQWYGAHPGVWTSAAWVAGAAWTPSPWNAVAGFVGYDGQPTSYNYGGNVVAQDGNVLVDGQSVGTTGEFSQQAADLAAAGRDAQISDADEWLPLGVFAMVRNEQQHPQLILQLAINKQGILRGNYTDEVTEHTQPIQGAVDKETQRAAWTVGDKTQTVMEAGLSDLTSGEAPALIHKNGKTDHWLLVRLEQPPQADNSSGK